MDLHKLLEPYAVNKNWYDAKGYVTLINTLLDYSNAHPWFHYHGTKVLDSNPNSCFHYVVLHWTEGQRPTINTFNFVRDQMGLGKTD